MNRPHVRLWVLAPLLVAVTAFAARRWVAEFGPDVDVAEVLDLGTHPSGGRFVTDLPIRNAGYGPLRVTDFRASCGACATFLGESDGTPAAKDIIVPAGETYRARISVTVAGLAGQAIRRGVEFRTNDPRRPVVRTELLVRVEGGLAPVPASLDLAALPRGGVTVRTVEIHDTGRATPLAVARVASSNPEQVRVRSVTRPGELVDAGKPQLGRVVCRVEVEIVSPARPGRVAAELQFFTDDPNVPALAVPVRGELPPPYVVSPATVVLPVRAGDGWRYAMECAIRRSDGRPFDLACESPPDELNVHIHDGVSSNLVRLVTVEWKDGHRPAGADLTARTVKLVATHAGGRDEFELAVKCRRPD